MKKASISLFFFFLLGCSKPANEIYQNKSFGDICSISRSKEKLFCIVLTDSTRNSSKEYNKLLQENYNFLTSEAVYNLVDINYQMNEWYVKWLCPASIPLTCIFSAEGILIDLIPGAARETFLYTEKALKTKAMTGFHWPNHFKRNKKQAIPLLNDILKNKEYINNGIYLSSELDKIIDSLQYPYSIYLKLVGELMENDTISSKNTAKSLIEMETPIFLELYKSEFITANKVLDPNFKVDTEANIRVDKDSISFTDCKLNKSEPFDIAIYNDGERPLKIPKIHLSCSCLEQVNNGEDIIVKPKDAYIAKFKFTPDEEGEVLRDVFITSNAINKPILHIAIQANTTK